MKKLFTEPEMEILTFRCEGAVEADSIEKGEGIQGGNEGNPPEDLATILG